MECKIRQVKSVGVILSGQYSDFEITQQYGLIPPSFLPVSGQRLYVSQVAYLRKFCSQIFLTVPENYELTSSDKMTLAVMKVTLIPSSPDISINDALLEVLDTIQSESNSIAVLYGDTLINEEIPINCVTIFEKPETYSWGRNKGISDYERYLNLSVEMMMAGFFYLSDAKLLKSAIHDSNGDILDALDCYTNYQPLQYQRVHTWNDFGHLGTLQQSQLFFSESRFFNLVKISELGVSKQSTDVDKLLAEIVWYENLPVQFRKYVPNLVAISDNAYTTEYIPSPTLHDLLIFGNLSLSQWIRLFDRLCAFFSEAKQCFEPPNQIVLEDLLRIKTQVRCELFLSSKPKLKDFDNLQLVDIFSKTNIDSLLSKINLTDTRSLGVIHGDMCATNIFWDGMSDTLKTIDPRGDTSGISKGIYGDIRYDVAKLYQSFVLGYDFVLAGLEREANVQEKSKSVSYLRHSSIDFDEIFQSKIFAPLGISQTEIAAIATLLMLGLMPLHADRIDRQNEFVHIILKMLKELKI